jgi:predicted MFS family arabinose efflux permease
MMLNLLAGCATGILQLAIPLYALELKASTAQLGLIAGFNGVGRLLVIIPCGLLIDRWGGRRLFLSSTLLATGAVLALFCVHYPGTLMLATGVLGTLQSVVFLSLQAGFLKRLPYLRPAQAGWQRGATQFGFFLMGPLLGGYLLRNGEFGPTFLVVSALFAVCLFTSLYRRWIGVHEVADSAVLRGTGKIARFRALLENRLFLQILGFECLGNAAFMVFRAFIGPVGVDVLHLPVQTVSWLIVSQGVAAMSVLLCSNRLLDGMSMSRLFGLSGSLMVAGSLLLALADGFTLFWLGTVLFGLGTGTVSFASLSRIGRIGGEKGMIAGLFSFSVALGNTLGPSAAGCVGTIFSPRAAFLTLVPVIASCGIAVYLTRLQRRRYEAVPEMAE